MPSFQGHFVRVIGIIGETESENEVILLEHDCPHTKFSEAVLNCLPKLPWLITEKVSYSFSDNYVRLVLCHQGASNQAYLILPVYNFPYFWKHVFCCLLLFVLTLW